jgi:hypothetical protein
MLFNAMIWAVCLFGMVLQNGCSQSVTTRSASNANGARVWVFADGYLPEKVHEGGKLESHEALMITNTGETPANVKLDLYFSDKDPIKDIPIKVGAERVICIRMDHPNEIGGVQIPPLTQYALRVRSDVKVVVQFGRLDTTQDNLAYYVNVGYTSD